MPEEFTRRLPSAETKISDLKRAKGRVAVVGTIVSKDKENSTFVLNDGKAQVLVISNNPDEFNNLTTGKLARVLGRPIGEGEELEILADIVQDFSKLDKETYDRVF